MSSLLKWLKKSHKKHKHKRHGVSGSSQGASPAGSVGNPNHAASPRAPYLSQLSARSDNEHTMYFDALEIMDEEGASPRTVANGLSPLSTHSSMVSATDGTPGGLSPSGSPSTLSTGGSDGLASPRTGLWARLSGTRRINSGEAPQGQGRLTPVGSMKGSVAGGGVAGTVVPEDAVLEPEGAGRGCLMPLLSHLSGPGKRMVRLERPPAGASFKRIASRAQTGEGKVQGKGEEAGSTPGIEEWEAADGESFMVRSHDYIRTRKKQHSSTAIYRLVAVDVYSFDFKINHIAQHVQLPPAPVLGDMSRLPPDQQLPPFLIFNVQLPSYPASIFGKSDGPGQSLVYYFALPEGWAPDQVENQAALRLLQRFVHNGAESDNAATRDRLKLIARVVNVEEWAKKAPLTNTEYKLLVNYNDKPLMTKPQHKFFNTSQYMEVDLDIHSYAYLARKAFHGFMSRLDTVVFENAFVIQGNRAEDLPEQVLACARVHRVDFSKSRPFPADDLNKVVNGERPT